MKRETVKRVALMMTPSQYKAARKAADKLNISFGELVRQSIAGRLTCLNFRQVGGKAGKS